MTLSLAGLDTSWQVPELTAVDKNGRVVKDTFGLLITDQRDKRIARYRQRWYVDGVARNRTFKRNQLDEAQRFRVALLDARDRGFVAGGDGRPVDATSPSPIEVAAPLSDSLFVDLTFALGTLSAGLQAKTRTGYRNTLEFVEYVADGERIPGFRPTMRTAELTPALCQDLLVFRRNTNLRTPGRTVSARTERLFSVYLNAMLELLTSRGRFASNPWDLVKKYVRRPERVVLSEANVASQDRVADIADVIAQIPGGRRFACPVRTAGKEAIRVGETRAVTEASFRDRDTDEPFLRLERSRPTVSARDDEHGSRHPDMPLKHRARGEHRDVPLFAGVSEDVDEHLSRYCGDGQPFFSFDNGHIPDDSSWLSKYWHPAVERVFGDSPEPALRDMQFRQLRHSAITWWLAAGVPVQQAAQWAGNSPEVLLKHYAGFTDKVTVPSDPRVRKVLFGGDQVSVQ